MCEFPLCEDLGQDEPASLGMLPRVGWLFDMSLLMGYHGPSADLPYPGVCASLYLFGLTQTPD